LDSRVLPVSENPFIVNACTDADAVFVVETGVDPWLDDADSFLLDTLVGACADPAARRTLTRCDVNNRGAGLDLLSTKEVAIAVVADVAPAGRYVLPK
jgi:hypothetical protein